MTDESEAPSIGAEVEPDSSHGADDDVSACKSKRVSGLVSAYTGMGEASKNAAPQARKLSFSPVKSPTSEKYFRHGNRGEVQSISIPSEPDLTRQQKRRAVCSSSLARHSVRNRDLLDKWKRHKQ
jgi:hypothetical protein